MINRQGIPISIPVKPGRVHDVPDHVFGRVFTWRGPYVDDIGERPCWLAAPGGIGPRDLIHSLPRRFERLLGGWKNGVPAISPQRTMTGGGGSGAEIQWIVVAIRMMASNRTGGPVPIGVGHDLAGRCGRDRQAVIVRGRTRHEQAGSSRLFLW